MTDRFIAINVGTGDAFYLERGDFSVLVDGGLDTGFPKRFREATNRSSVDVLVCTHNDSDHTNGIIEFIDAGFGAKEVWLPATWLEALEDLLRTPDDVVFNLLLEDTEGDEARPIVPTDADDEKPASRSSSARDGRTVAADEIDRLLDDTADQDPRLDSLTPMTHWILLPGGGRHILHGKTGASSKAKAAKARSLVLNASNIRRIAIAATRKRIRIRWFDPEINPSQPSPTGKLHVLSATEVRAIRRTALSTPDVLRLTEANRESLVLYSPETSSAPAVLFCADSGLDRVGTLPGGPSMLITAPHHGSNDKANVAAYAKLASAHPTDCNDWTWVRSDKRFASGRPRPCASYLKQRRRYCTNCRGTYQSRDIRFHGAGTTWIPDPPTNGCNCTEQ